MKLIRLCACVVALAAVSPAVAGDAKGRFVVKGGKTSGTIAPTQAAAYVTRDPRHSPDENASSASDLLQAWLPKSGLKIVGGERRGDTADLDVEGEMFPGTNALYLSRLRRVDGTWLFESAGIVGMLR